MDGWIKLYRRFLSWQWFNKSEMVQIFVYILLSASHKDHPWQNVVIRRGEFPTSVDSISRATGLTTQQVRTCLSRLERTGEITRKSTNKFTIISVCNFDDYQLDEETEQQTNNKQITNKQQTNNNQITTLGEWKERKNGENGENIDKTTRTTSSKNLINAHAREGFSLSMLNEDEAAAERREFYRIFWLNNALCPSKQVKQFIAANERNQWTDRAGNVWTTPQQRKAAAEGYCLDREFQTARNNEFFVLKKIYDGLVACGNKDADKWMMSDFVGCESTTANQLVLHAPRECVDFLATDKGKAIVDSLNLAPGWTFHTSTKRFYRK